MDANEAQLLPHEFTRAVTRVGRHHAPSYRLSRQLPGITAETILADNRLIHDLVRSSDAAAAWRQVEGIATAAASWNVPLDVGDVNALRHSAKNCVMLLRALHEAALRLDQQLGLAPGADGKASLRVPGNKASIAKVLNYADRADMRAVALAQTLRNIHDCRGTRILDRDTDLALAEILSGSDKRRKARIALRSRRIHVGKIPLKPGQVKVRFDTGLVAESLPDEIEVAECDKCGASMTERARRKGAHYLSCGYCGHTRELAAPAARIAVAQDLAKALGEQRALLQPLPDMVGWRCDECGAEAITGASGIVARCAYCGSTHFTRIEGEGVVRPQGMLRFACDQDRAEEMIREYLHAQGDVEYGFARDFEVETAQARYVPYWVFNLTEPFGNSVSNVCSCASRQLLHRLPAELRAIEPFPIAALPPFEPSHLVGTVAERYSVDVEEALVHSFKLGSNGDRSLAGVKDLPRGTSVAFRYVLVPVWFFVLRWKGGEYHALVDGSGAGVGIRYPKTRVRAVLRRVPLVAAAVLMIPIMFVLLQWLADSARNRAEADRMAQAAALIDQQTKAREWHMRSEAELRGQYQTGTLSSLPYFPSRTRSPELSQLQPISWSATADRGHPTIHANEVIWVDLLVEVSAVPAGQVATLSEMLASDADRESREKIFAARCEGLYWHQSDQLMHESNAYWTGSLVDDLEEHYRKQGVTVDLVLLAPRVRVDYPMADNLVCIEGYAKNVERVFRMTLRLPAHANRTEWIQFMRGRQLYDEIAYAIQMAALSKPRKDHPKVAEEAARQAVGSWLKRQNLDGNPVPTIESFELD